MSLRFRSPLLDALPRGPRAHKPGRMLWRAVWVGVALGLLALVCWLILDRRITAGSWLANVAYGFHDKVFLPLRGWTLTRFYPYSLIPWALLLAAVATWVYTAVTGVPLFRGRHLRWTRWALRRPGLHGALARSARLGQRVGVRPTFLRSVLAQELGASIDDLAGLPTGLPSGSETDLPKRLAGLMTLRSELDGTAKVARSERMETLCLWQQAKRIIRLRGGEGEALEQIHMLAPAVLGPFLKTPMRGEADFHGGSLVADVLRLAIADGAMDAETGKSYGIRDPLSELRRRVLERLSMVEGWSVALREGSSAMGVPRTAEESSAGSQCGRLFMDLALDLAAREKSAVFARELLDPMDGLRFVLRAGGSRIRTPNRADLAALLDRLPRPADYRAAAVLEERSLNRLDRAAASARIYKTALFTPEDLAKARQRAEDLALAAGPEG